MKQIVSLALDRWQATPPRLPMHRCRIAVSALLLLVACGHASAPPAADSAVAVARVDDSILALRTTHAPAFADSARATMAVLLKHPETVTYDSIVVVQPPKDAGSWPAPWVCGRIGGKPGIGGRSTMTPFVYQNRINVFLLDEKNGTAFAAIRAKGCDNPGARVVLR